MDERTANEAGDFLQGWAKYRALSWETTTSYFVMLITACWLAEQTAHVSCITIQQKVRD